MIWDGLIQSWGHDPNGMSDDEKTLIVAAVADRVEEVREAQLLLYLVRGALVSANRCFNEAEVTPEVLSKQAAIARSLNGILKLFGDGEGSLKKERDLIHLEKSTSEESPTEEEVGGLYGGPTTSSMGAV